MGKYRQYLRKYASKIHGISLEVLVTLACIIYIISTLFGGSATVDFNRQEMSAAVKLGPIAPALELEKAPPQDAPNIVPPTPTPCIPVVVWPNALFCPINQKIIMEWYGRAYDGLRGEIQAIAESSCNTGHFPDGELCGSVLEVGEKRFDLAAVQNEIKWPSSPPQTERKICESEKDDVRAWKMWNRLQKEELTLPRELHGISINDPTLGFRWLKDIEGGELAWSIFTPYHFASNIPEIREGVVTTAGYSLDPSLIYCLKADFPHFSVPVSGIMSRMIWDMKVSFPENLPMEEADYRWFVPNHFRRIVGEKFYSFLLNTAFHSHRLTSGVGAVARQLLAQILENIPQENKDSLRMELGNIYCAATVGDEEFKDNTLLQNIFSEDKESWVDEYGNYASFFARRIARNAISPALLPSEEINVRLEVVREMHRQIGLAIEEVGDVPPRCAEGKVVTVNSSSVQEEDPSKTNLPETHVRPGRDIAEDL